MLFTLEKASEWFDYMMDNMKQLKPGRVPEFLNYESFGSDGTGFVSKQGTYRYHSVTGPSWAKIFVDDHQIRSAPEILPYSGKYAELGVNTRLYLFFEVNDVSLSYKEWLKHPLVVENRVCYIINDVLEEKE